MKPEETEKQIAAETVARGRKALEEALHELQTMDRTLKDPLKK